MSVKEKHGHQIGDPFGTYFVTFTIVGWVDLFTRKECRDIVIESLHYCQCNKGLVVNAYVIMPSHIHLILRAKEHTTGLSDIIRDMKRHMAKQLLDWVHNNNLESRSDWLLHIFAYYAKQVKNKSQYQLWRRGNQPKLCEHPKFTMQKINYIHQNPVTAYIVDVAENYLYSSARNYLDRSETILDVEVIDFGIQEGYVAT